MTIPTIHQAQQPNVRSEMQRHRSATTQPKRHTASELERLAGGVCEDLADRTPWEERLAGRVLIVAGAIVIFGVVCKAMGVL